MGCIFGLPFMHAVLPHSPLHVKCLADTEEHVEAGHVKNIVVYVRETRLTNLFSNVMIGLSLFFLTYALTIIPTAVLDGLFLYLAVTALYGNQMFERIQLFFTEQSAYPPKSLCQNGSRERNAQVYHLPNFAIGHFMRLWIQSMAICKDDLSYSSFYIFTHQTQVDSTISRKEVPRCS